MRDAFRECPVNMHQKSQNNRRMPLSKNLATKGNAQHCVAYGNRIEENHKVHYIRKSCTMLALQRRFTIFQVCLVVFLGPLRCKSGSANNLNIMFHVCSLPVISESPFNLNCTKNASKFATRNQKTLFGKLFQGYWRCPALLKNQSGQLPGPSIQLSQKLETNSKTYKDRMLTIVLWRQMKGIWEKYGEIRENMKGQENHYRKEPGWILFCGISQGEKLFQQGY